MLNFQNDPPTDSRGVSLPLMRCPANRSYTGIILSDDIVGTNTHYYRGRTMPCDQGNCDACNDGFPWRWHAYLVLYSRATHSKILFEMTAKSVEPLLIYRKAYETLRGCELSAKRANTSHNSRVIITTRRADLQQIVLPDCPDILKALSIIWNIEVPAISKNGRNRNAQALNVEKNLNLREQTLKMNTPPSQSQNPQPTEDC